MAHVLGVPAGAYIGTLFGWDKTFIVLATRGLFAATAIPTIINIQI